MPSIDFQPASCECTYVVHVQSLIDIYSSYSKYVQPTSGKLRLLCLQFFGTLDLRRGVGSPGEGLRLEAISQVSNVVAISISQESDILEADEV
jgi:hypothetical protein